LTTNTEVSIAPKLQRSQGPATSTPSKSATTATKTTDSSLQQDTTIVEDATRWNAQILRVLPQRLLRSACSEYNGPELTAYVSPTTYSRLRPSRGFDTNTATVLCFDATLKRLPPPVDPSLTTLPTSPAPAPIPRILKPDAPGKADHVDAQQDGTPRRVFVGWAEGMPENHAVFPALPDSVEEWDIVQ
jgi:peroxin-1